ncbi:acanthoscurrin-2-like [Hyposmocoma kahamanoa]|uniref:acanthoscurrin-2-like n=1 Tax=Hyposmocoma kahamanoa TaxID=1477025 RepID=UPI000E6D73AA|nr:acanthoscurrin-2-like [Hyposmocoma kahamanoa]
MKAIVVLALVALTSCAYADTEKKQEKRDALGLGYGLGAPLVGHGYGGYYGHGLGLFNHGLHSSGLYGGGLYGGGLHGGGLYGGGLYGHGLYGHGFVAPPLLGRGLYGGAPLLGFGHGYLH